MDGTNTTRPQEQNPPRAELVQLKGVCPHDCPDTCGWVVTVDRRTGRAVDLRGDPEHPFTRGFLCQKVARYLERVYHRERLLYPLQRVGPKGAGQFRRISWPEAIAQIADRFRTIIAEDGPQAILPYSYAGTMGKLMYGSLDRRFFHRLGASVLARTICSTAGEEGCNITLGTRAMIDPEAAVHCRYIINWGSNTAVTNVHFWRIEHEARRQGARIVTIDPYRSPTAARSDWWLPTRPGTDAALALGLMHIIFRENWQDADYLQRYCVGAEALRERVLRDYPVERVAHITGLSVTDIEQLAREYACARALFGGPALIRLNYGVQRHGGGAMAVRTITCLPALTGDWRYPGAGAFLSTSKAYGFDDTVLTRPDLIPPGTRIINMVQLAEALLGELEGPPIRALFVYNANPATVCPDQNRVRAGLAREDLFTVVHDLFLTDTAAYADIVLPATSQLEHFDLHSSYGHLYVQANNPAIAPLGEAKPNTEVFRLLAQAMGFEEQLWADDDETLAALCLHGRGPLEGITLAAVRSGPVRLNLPRPWAPFAEGKFPTPSGKCELYSEREARAGRDPLPHYVPPHEDPQTHPELAARYPLQLLSPPAPSFLNSTFVNVDSLRQQAGEPTLEIHPQDAEPRQIRTGDWVVIFNDRGRFRAKAKVGPTVRPGVVVSLGNWWKRYAPEGVNSNVTTSTALSDLGGGATFFDNLVEVRRAAEAEPGVSLGAKQGTSPAA
jgi:anaerobic selenocysteine-containing dehydrogenase